MPRPGRYRSLHLSPDGKRLAAELDADGYNEIQVYDFVRQTWTPLTFGAKRVFFQPAWTPDGQYVIFGSLTGLYWAPADRVSEPHPFFPQTSPQGIPSVAQDGKWLLYSEGDGSFAELWAAPLNSAGNRLVAGTPEHLLKGASQVRNAVLSPDGKWLAYQATSSGATDVYVRAFPDNGGLWKISAAGGQNPIWSPNGRDLLYQSDDQIMAVGYSADRGTFQAEKVRVWLDKVGGVAFGLFPDGKRLLVLTTVDSSAAARPIHEIVLFQNFFEYLRQHAPSP
jgi:Tol biopolymer transport system component